MNADDQPGKVLDAGSSFYRLQLSNSQVPSMIESVDRQARGVQIRSSFSTDVVYGWLWVCFLVVGKGFD